jgi:hypothetical protein
MCLVTPFSLATLHILTNVTNVSELTRFSFCSRFDTSWSKFFSQKFNSTFLKILAFIAHLKFQFTICVLFWKIGKPNLLVQLKDTVAKIFANF